MGEGRFCFSLPPERQDAQYVWLHRVWWYVGKYGDFFSASVPVSWCARNDMPDSYYDNWAKVPTRAYYGVGENKDEFPSMAGSMNGNSSLFSPTP